MIVRLFATVAILIALCPLGFGAELVRLTEANWDEYAPQGKEADAIYGDFLLRNDVISLVVARPVPTRNANMTVKNVGGAIIDMTRRDRQSDQLSAFYPDGANFAYGAPEARANDGDWSALNEQSTRLTGKTIELRLVAAAAPGKPLATLVYRLEDGRPFVHVTTTFENPHDKSITGLRSDSMRADRDFDMGFDKDLGLFWADENYWRQAYGVVGDGIEAVPSQGGMKSKRPVIDYRAEGNPKVEIAPGGRVTHSRLLIVGAQRLDLRAALAEGPLRKIDLKVVDPAGPVAGARVSVERDGQSLGSGRTDDEGRLAFQLDEGGATLHITAQGRPAAEAPILKLGDHTMTANMEAAGYVAAKITDADGQSIPCKVAFRGLGDTPTPDFGPDTAEHAVRDLYYAHDGAFRQELLPGKYEVIVSHGSEYDASIEEIEIHQGEITPLEVKLAHAVDTSGWISADFHSHSSPSGDNTSSQMGRVLNLLAEHIEFAPCTEHNRISSYSQHLEKLGAVARMATCPGMELTGSPLPINHQNTFPLHRHVHHQDGGGPTTHADPVVQIERLALWDEASDKLVQVNHPYIAQMIGDRNADGKADGGFETMFGWMDVIEIHPHGRIFEKPAPLPTGGRDRGNTIYQWLQMLNLGYRIPGVVNTDAHYNHHGSGWLRNYIKSPTDDPAEVEPLDVVHASRRGNLTMTNGPFLEVELASGAARGGPGDDVAASSGDATLHVRVQCPNWIDINRVQVFLNGRPDPKLNFTRKTAADRFATATVKFDQEIPLHLHGDTHVVVAVAGEGLKLGPVMGASAGATMPAAVANPIFVDVDGGGFQANGDGLDFPLLVPHEHHPAPRRKR
ncbi:MAG: CehA/McbA family metallohydrolase [Planctomycetales bacterium]|nr:CehA/McbA family metallohydrolase [Planctomycetales bacterium]